MDDETLASIPLLAVLDKRARKQVLRTAREAHYAALIEEHGRTATVVAEDELDCLLISAWEFKASLDEHPQMAIPMLNAMIARLHRREHHAG